MAKADLNRTDDGAIEIWFHADHRELGLIRAVPGVKWDKPNDIWRAPFSWGTAYAAAGIFGAGLNPSEDLVAYTRQRFTDEIMPLLALREQADTEWFDTRLSPLQRVGAKFLLEAGRAFLADGMGAGKTIQTISALHAIEDRAQTNDLPGPLPLLIICPNSMKYTWQDELNIWWPEISSVVCDGGMLTRRKQIASVRDGDHGVLIINWESFWRHSSIAAYPGTTATEKEREPKELQEIPWAAIVADESHRAMDPSTKQTRGLWSVGKMSSVVYRFALTGTPVEKSPDQLWPQLHFLSPENWPTKTKYIDRYCLQTWSRWGMEIAGINSHTAAEFYSILNPMYLRRPKELILPDLPPKRRQQRVVEMAPKQAKAYKQMQKDMLAALDDDTLLVATNPLTVATRLSQLASAYATVEDLPTEEGAPVKQLVTMKSPSCKVDALEEIIDEMGGDQLVVFAEHKELLNLCSAMLQKKKIPHGFITGDYSTVERHLFTQQYQDGELRVMLLTYGAGAEAITLTAGNTAVMLQRHRSSIKNAQAEDRVHRGGAEIHDAVYIIEVLAKGTIDMLRLNTYHDKKTDVAELLRDEETLRIILGAKPKRKSKQTV